MKSYKIRRKFFKKIPKRYLTCFMCYIIYLSMCVSRELFQRGIGAVVYPPEPHMHYSDQGICNVTFLIPEISIPMANEFMYHWTPEVVQRIDLFSWYGTLIAKIPGGIFADLHGGRLFLQVTALASAVQCLIGPSLIRYCRGYHDVLAYWAGFFGLVVGPCDPALNTILTQWVPTEKRTIFIALAVSTVTFAEMVGGVLFKLMAYQTNDWASASYLWFGFTILWSLLWYLYGFSTPETHPFLDGKEAEYLEETVGVYNVPLKQKSVPWLKMLLSPAIWGSLINYLGHIWLLFFLTFFLVPYLEKDVKIFSLENIVSLLPFFGSTTLFAIIIGLLSDLILTKKVMTVTTLRKICCNSGSLGAGFYSILIVYSGCDQIVVTSLFFCVMIFYTINDVGMQANQMDVTSNYAGTMKGVSSFLIRGSVMLLGLRLQVLIEEKFQKNIAGLQYAFWTCLGLVTCTSFIFALIGSGQEQSWNRTRKRRLSI